jgi:hypothetical protein
MAVGLVMSGGVAAASTDTAPAVDIGWKAGEDAPFAATRFDGETVGKRVYFLGFRTADNGTDGSIWYYDIKKGKYVDTKVDMAVPISNYTVVPLEDKTGLGLYTFGGRTADGETTDVVQVFYPDSEKTKVIDTDPWPGTTPSDCVSMPATGVVAVKNKAYALGGNSFSTSIPACQDDNSKEVWSFDPKGKNGKKWKSEPSLKVARGYVSAVAVDGKTIYAIGGDVNEAGTLVPSDVVESWKIGSKKWSDKPADLPMPCDETQAFAFDGGKLGGTITLAGCGQWPSAVPDVLQYDVAKDKWSTVGSLNEARRNHAGANIGSASKPKLFVFGGYGADGGTALLTSEIGTPGKGAATSAPAVAPVPGALLTTH